MTDPLPVHSTVTAAEHGKNNSKQRPILKRTCSKDHSETESAPSAQKVRMEKEASSTGTLAASALVPVSHQNPTSAGAVAVAAAAVTVAGTTTAGNVVEVKRSHQKGASSSHQKKLLVASQAVTLTLPADIRQPLSSTSSLSAPLILPNFQSNTSVCSRVAQANILKSDPLTSIAYQTFSGTNTAICRCV